MNTDTYNVIMSEGMVIHTSSNETHTAFVGIVDNKTLQTPSIIKRAYELLIRGINNRTRERNYFRKYCELLNGDVSDEEFDKEIEVNEDEYIVKEDEDVDNIDGKIALVLASHIKDSQYLEDISTLFSFKPNSLQKLIESE